MVRLGDRRWLRAGALVLALAVMRPSAASELTPLLDAADAARTADPVRLTALLDRMRAMRGQATPAERDRLILLESYEQLLSGHHAQAVASARRVAAQAQDPNLRYRAAMLVMNLSAISRDYALGIDYFGRALVLEPRVTDHEVLELGWAAAGTFFSQFDQPEIAQRYTRRLLTSHTPRTRCFGYENDVRARLSLGRQNVTERDLQQALEACRQADEPIGVQLVHTTYARYLMATGRPRAALRILEGNFDAARDTRYVRLVAEFHSLIAECHLALHEPREAERAARAALAVPGQDTRWAPLIAAERVLYQTTRLRGDYREATLHLETFTSAERSLLDDLKAREAAFQAGQIVALRSAQQAQRLRDENQRLALQSRLTRERRGFLWALVGLLTAAVAATAYWGWRAKRAQNAFRRLSEVDPLTGVSNRRHFRRRTLAALEAAKPTAAPVSLLVLDLDHFKDINDRVGHAAGDHVLIEVGRIGRALCTREATFGRLGGEEFAMCLPGQALVQAQATAEHLLSMIRAIDLGPDGGGLQISASIGISCTTLGSYDYEALYRAADESMYTAKRAGRDRITASNGLPA